MALIFPIRVIRVIRGKFFFSAWKGDLPGIIERIQYKKRIHPYDHSTLENVLCGYDWPGNIRQLEGMCKGVILTSKPGNIVGACSDYMVTKRGHVEDHNLTEILKSIRRYPCFNEMKVTWLKAALDKADGNLTQAAAWAQMDKRNFRRMAKAAGLHEVK